MFIKRLCSVIASISLCLSVVSATSPDFDLTDVPTSPYDEIALSPNVPELNAVGLSLFCVESDQFLYSRELHTKLAPASITKLMTALVVYEEGIDLEELATVSYDAVHSLEDGATHIALDTDEEVPVYDLMAAMLIESANDAANVLAEHVGGTIDDFVSMMNEKAEEIGCLNTNFVNPNGLYDENHYTTVYDMALIGKALMEYPEVFDYIGSTYYEMAPTNKQEETRYFWTKQDFLKQNSSWYDENVIGGKNGYTMLAKQSLVTFSQKDDITLIAVAICGENKTDQLTDTQNLFDYGYNEFSPYIIAADDLTTAAHTIYPDDIVSDMSSQMVLIPNLSEIEIDIVCSGTIDDAQLDVCLGATTLTSIPFDVTRIVQEEVVTMEEVEVEETQSVFSTLLSIDTSNVKNIAIKVAIGLGVLLVVIFVLTSMYRVSKIKKQRQEIRELRERHRQNNQ